MGRVFFLLFKIVKSQYYYKYVNNIKMDGQMFTSRHHTKYDAKFHLS